MICTLFEIPLPWQSRGLHETASGYGAKLTSTLSVRVDGEHRYRRVYVTCFSNAGTAWFTYQGKRIALPDTAAAGDTIELEG